MTINGLSGSLLSHDALARQVRDRLRGELDEAGCAEARRRMRGWHAPLRLTLGPASGTRAVLDLLALPLVAHLGFRATLFNRSGAPPYAVLQVRERDSAVLIVTAWGADAGGAWRDAVRRGIGHALRWCLCVNGPAVRLFDARRAYSRRHAEFDLLLALDDEVTFAFFWGLLRAEAVGTVEGTPVLDRAVELCERHRSAVRESLKTGVHEALGHLGGAFLSGRSDARSEARALDESLIVVYRILFLLFAEARALVPRWHPVYRDGYTIESLRATVESPRQPRGLWESLQAIARLAHRGCRAGTLRVPAFNGRLFSPADAPLAESARLDDEAVRRALLALTTRRGTDGRERIAYADLGVEQLGAVYEHVLDYAPARGAGGAIELRPTGRRKATGTFYTPRALTEYLVRRTLGPLVDDAGPDDILRLRIVDPAMGSGAFLVAACRYLAHAYEHALVRERGYTASDIGDADRVGFRRTIAQRCLFGVDVNPMAVQLARLSLWLATLAGDRPLTFLDHRLRAGDSLVGASTGDIRRQPPSGGGKRARPARLPLFPHHAFESSLRGIVSPRLALATGSGDTLDQVRQKERTLAWLNSESGPLARWKLAADLWCAAWFVRGADGRTFDALLREVVDGSGPLPRNVATPLLLRIRGAAASGRFFHWTLEFPEAFYEEDGVPLDAGGFDAVLGNPPWETLRGDACGAERSPALTRFARESGIYPLQGKGHANLYQLFVERALSLVRPGGRLGFIVPSGLATDHGCAALRHELIERTTIDTFVTIDNRDAVFPIHRGLKFTLFALTRGGCTDLLPARAGIRDVTALDRLPDGEADPESVPISRALLRRLGGEDLAVPEIRSRLDLDVVSRVALSVPALGDADGWNLRFGRELNATDDRPHFTSRGLPIVEGKHLQPCRIDTASATFRIDAKTAARLLRGRPFERARLAYREVASATNRLTLIAAIVPAGVVTTHTVFCVKAPPDAEAQQFLCGVFNSLVANYLVRMRVGTHVTAAVIDRLPAPKPSRDSAIFREIAGLARELATRDDGEAYARLQAAAARLYGLDEEEFSHVLDAFPLIPRAVREAALVLFRGIVR